MRRTLVGWRGLIAGVSGLGQLGFGAGQTIGQLGYLAGELEDDAVLLLHMPLQEGQTFLEIVKLGVHAIEDGGQVGRGKPMRGVCDYYDNLGPLPCFTDCLSTISVWNACMSSPQDESAEASPSTPLHRPNRTLWQRLGGEGLALSILIHVLLVIIAVIWVVSTVTDLSGKKDPNTFATGAGGGSGGPKAKEYKTKLQPKNVKALTKTSSRITSKNANASMSISSVPTMANPLATAGAVGGGSSKGFGGGSGGGIGTGKGTGVGGGKNFVSLFGMKGSTAVGTGGLLGTFYDLKQTSGRQPTAMLDGKTGIAPYRAAVRDFLEAGWSPGKLSKFYKAPDTLISGQLFITGRSANDAPKAFEVEKEVKPSRWVIHYRCYVEVPSSLPFRFVGSGDDFLLVRWNRKIALDDGYETYLAGGGNYKDFGVKVTQEYKVDRKPGSLHRLKAGPWIQATKGTKVPVEVLIGETPGGVFDCYLAIEVAKPGAKVDGQYVGEGKLKLFRCNADPLPAEIARDKRGLNIDMEAAGWIFKVTKDANTAIR